MTTIYISGFTGFIGSQLMSTLKEDGLVVKGIDIRNQNTYCKLLPLLTSSDAYVHLGEPSSTKFELKSNSPEFIALAEAFRDKFIYASSSLVYGIQTEKPHGTEDPCLSISAYTKLKIQREAIVRDHGGYILRLSNVYGPGSRKGLISKVFSCLVQREEFDFSRGDAIRDYIFINDVIEVFRKVLILIQDKTETSQYIYNVGSGKGTKTSQLIHIVERITGLRLLGGGFSGSTITNINRLEIQSTKSTLNWESKVSLSQGLEVIWKYLNKERLLG